MVATAWGVQLLAGAAEQDFPAGHLPAFAQLVGSLFPHRHGYPFPPVSPGHERVRGIELLLVSPISLVLRLCLGNISRTASVNGPLPVQVWPPPPAGIKDEKPRQHGQ